MPSRMPAFSAAQLESLCKTLGDTSLGLTGSEIAHLLAQARVVDTDPTLTKWKRLYNALVSRQNADADGNRVFAFISHAMAPARYQGDPTLFHARCIRINATLAYLGYEFQEDGKFHACKRATTLSEAEARAYRLRSGLEQRGVHADVLMFCRAELVEQNCFHAVLEACKSVAAKIRSRSGLTSDGVPLVQEALGGSTPRILINTFQTDSERSEQRGFVNLASGLFGTFRNPTAHAARIEWPVGEEDALDILSLASYIHRRIDSATVAPP
jgi:uncharacterized protein (TIGR02391 family)